MGRRPVDTMQQQGGLGKQQRKLLSSLGQAMAPVSPDLAAALAPFPAPAHAPFPAPFPSLFPLVLGDFYCSRSGKCSIILR